MINLFVVGGSEASIFWLGQEYLKQEYNLNVKVKNHSGCKLEECISQLKHKVDPQTDLIMLWAVIPCAWKRILIKTKRRRRITL